MRNIVLGLALFLTGYFMMVIGFEPIQPLNVQYPALVVITLASDFHSCLVIASAIMIYGLYKRKKEAALPLLGLLLATLLTHIIKVHVDRPRPFSGGMSFPSGHSSSASSTYLPLAKGKSSSSAYIAFIILVGISRILVGAHYLSDIIAGIGLGISASSFMKVAYEKVISLISFRRSQLHMQDL